MWLLTDANAANTSVIPAAITAKSCEAPPDSSAHDPAYGAATPPTRPTATAVPTPVPRMPVGYTCAASAYIVVCTALMRPPVHASIVNTATLACGPIDITVNPIAPTMAP